MGESLKNHWGAQCAVRKRIRKDIIEKGGPILVGVPVMGNKPGRRCNPMGVPGVVSASGSPTLVRGAFARGKGHSRGGGSWTR